jgi:hypothetical protein
MKRWMKLVVLGLFIGGCLTPVSYNEYVKGKRSSIMIITPDGLESGDTHHKPGHQNGWGGVTCIEAKELIEIGNDLMAVVTKNRMNTVTNTSYAFLNWLSDGTARMLWMMKSSATAKCKDAEFSP